MRNSTDEKKYNTSLSKEKFLIRKMFCGCFCAMHCQKEALTVVFLSETIRTDCFLQLGGENIFYFDSFQNFVLSESFRNNF